MIMSCEEKEQQYVTIEWLFTHSTAQKLKLTDQFLDVHMKEIIY